MNLLCNFSPYISLPHLQSPLHHVLLYQCQGSVNARIICKIASNYRKRLNSITLKSKTFLQEKSPKNKQILFKSTRMLPWEWSRLELDRSHFRNDQSGGGGNFCVFIIFIILWGQFIYKVFLINQTKKNHILNLKYLGLFPMALKYFVL